MKKLFIVMSLLLVFGLESCNKWLDLRPESETVLEDYWQSESQATSELAGCYRAMIRDSYMERVVAWGELRSDNIVAGNSADGDLYKFMNSNITPTNGFANWGPFYSVINYCNTFLYYVPSVLNKDQNFTPTKMHTLEAEALTLRALSYFYLVRTFKEVPLILNPSVNDAQNYNIPKSSERVILDQIIADLLEAQKYARPSYGKEAFNKGRVTLNAVNAILADVYLWDQQYDKCAEACDLVLKDKTLKLVEGKDVLTDVFYTGNSTESIFELQFDKDIQFNNTTKNFYGSQSVKLGKLAYAFYLGPKGTYSPFNYFPTTLNESKDDIRQASFFGTTTNGLGLSIYKYALYDYAVLTDLTVLPIYRTTTSNWILYRLSDVMLMKAEALVQLNRDNSDLKNALDLVNITYLRSNAVTDSLKLSNYNDKTLVQDLVLRERQREFLFEGKRWFDLMRLVRRNNDPTVMLRFISPKLVGDNIQIKKLEVMNALYLPVLQSEIEVNPQLTQNPFYEDTNLTAN